MDPNPNVLLHGARLAGEAKAKQLQIHMPRQIRQHHHFPAQAAVLLTSEDPQTRLRCKDPTLLIPRVGSAYKPEGYSRHSPNQLNIFINLRDNRYRYLDLTDSRSMTAARTTSNVGACPVVPPSSCGYQQGEPTPYLVSCLLRRARISYNRISFGHEQYQARRTPVEYTCPVVPLR